MTQADWIAVAYLQWKLVPNAVCLLPPPIDITADSGEGSALSEPSSIENAVGRGLAFLLEILLAPCTPKVVKVNVASLYVSADVDALPTTKRRGVSRLRRTASWR